MRAKRSRDLATVRDLYVKEGLNQSAIERRMEQRGYHITRNTVADWKRWDKEHNALDWDELRSQHHAESPFASLEILRKRRRMLISAKGLSLGDGSFATELTQLDNAIEREERRLCNPDRVITGMEVLGHGAIQLGIPDDELAVLRKWIRAVGDALAEGKVAVQFND